MRNPNYELTLMHNPDFNPNGKTLAAVIYNPPRYDPYKSPPAVMDWHCRSEQVPNILKKVIDACVKAEAMDVLKVAEHIVELCSNGHMAATLQVRWG